ADGRVRSQARRGRARMAPRSAQAACCLRRAVERRAAAAHGADLRDMRLVPLDSPRLFDLAAGWLALKENYQWLDFGDGRQLVTPALLKIMRSGKRTS